MSHPDQGLRCPCGAKEAIIRPALRIVAILGFRSSGWARRDHDRPDSRPAPNLNRRARAHRLDHFPAGFEVPLGDGNRTSVEDVIITRSNDCRLRPIATDWVKNGDRWTITGIGRRGDLTVRHNRIKTA
jgi:hypothetical protein